MSYRLEHANRHYITLNHDEYTQALEDLATALDDIVSRLARNRIKRKSSGICAALVDAQAPYNSRKVAEWLMRIWPECRASLEYPVEGEEELYQNATNMWELNTEFGDKRRRLLKFLIESVKELRS